jgi:hypothetical protein
MVYKHIQQANMDRFDALKNGQAVEAVVIPTDEARNRHLRHVTKRQSLRSVSDNNSAYMPSGAPKREHSVRSKKALTPQKVPRPGSPESAQCPLGIRITLIAPREEASSWNWPPSTIQRCFTGVLTYERNTNTSTRASLRLQRATKT